MTKEEIRLTQYSHGAGCGCKIAPNILEAILSNSLTMPDNHKVIVGNHTKDDAAVYDIGGGQYVISTTDFFMPIVDDPYEFGRIASANAISDIYAMGGKPIMAIAILGWPINVLSPDVAAEVISGSKSICLEAGIPLAGGHSIDAPEPIFGLAVTGLTTPEKLKQNNTAKVGDLLFLTKPIGVGILTTAEKKGLLKPEHVGLAAKQMMQLNAIGALIADLKEVHAMTDVTGFGLLGHLVEMCEGSNCSATIQLDSIPFIIPDLEYYLSSNAIPGGTVRNWNAYGHHISIDKSMDAAVTKHLLADPQTSGGLLVAVSPAGVDSFKQLLQNAGLNDFIDPIGIMRHRDSNQLVSVVR